MIFKNPYLYIGLLNFPLSVLENKLQNVHSRKIYFFQVLVVDKPSPPVGPLDVSDITPDTCSLSWKPPLDDGGSPITNYIVEKMDNIGVSV